MHKKIKKIKILLAITQGERGGAQEYVLRLASSLPKEQYEVTVACGPDGAEPYNLLKQAQAQSLKTVELKWLRRDILPYQDIRALVELVAFLGRQKFDVTHFVSTKAGVLGRMAARLTLRPAIVYTVQGFVFNELLSPRKKLAYTWVERIGGWLGHYLITVAKNEEEQALKLRIGRSSKIKTIANGIEVAKIPQADLTAEREHWRKHFGLAANAPVIGTIANFYPPKGLPVLIEAAALLKTRLPHARFVVIGDGELRPHLEKLIETHALQEQMILAGKHSEAYKVLPLFDVFALPSIKEGLPFALLEAMTAGLPCVASEIGGIPDVIHPEQTGLLMPPARPEILAEKLVYLLENEAERKRLGQAAREKALNEFDYSIMVSQTEQVYQSLLAKKISKKEQY